MSSDLHSGLIPALAVIAAVLILEEWAYFKARSKLQRAIITGIAVFILVVILNIPLDAI